MMQAFKCVIIPPKTHTHTPSPFSWQPQLIPFALVHPQPINISQTWQHTRKFEQPWREASCMPSLHPLWNLYQLSAQLLFLKSRSLSFLVFFFSVPVVFINKLSEPILNRNDSRFHCSPVINWCCTRLGFPPSPFRLFSFSRNSKSADFVLGALFSYMIQFPTYKGVHTKGNSHFRWCFPDGKCNDKAHGAQQNGALQILSLF